MKKLIMVLLACCAGIPAAAQTRSVQLQGLLASAGRPHAVSVQLMRASDMCGPVASCASVGVERRYGMTADPCVTSALGCHLSSLRPDWSRSWNVGGLKLSSEVGRVSFSLGRHRDNLVPSQATFAEGAYLMHPGSFALGVESARGNGMAYVAYRLTF